MFVLGVVFLYVIDLTLITRGGPMAIRYMLDLLVYASHHSLVAAEMLY